MVKELEKAHITFSKEQMTMKRISIKRNYLKLTLSGKHGYITNKTFKTCKCFLSIPHTF